MKEQPPAGGHGRAHGEVVDHLHVAAGGAGHVG
jgi:hypothetical protein